MTDWGWTTTRIFSGLKRWRYKRGTMGLILRKFHFPQRELLQLDRSERIENHGDPGLPAPRRDLKPEFPFRPLAVHQRGKVVEIAFFRPVPVRLPEKHTDLVERTVRRALQVSQHVAVPRLQLQIAKNPGSGGFTETAKSRDSTADVFKRRKLFRNELPFPVCGVPDLNPGGRQADR